MKYVREIKVGVLAAVCLFLLFFGFNFLKGKNIFSPTNSYHGIYAHLHGLEEQAAVYVCGHKVGQVNAIHYDFTRDSAFIVDISINKDIALPQGTTMALIPDGLMGGVAVELQLPQSTPSNDQAPIEKGSYLSTTYVPSLMESLQSELLAKVSAAVEDVDSLVAELKTQVEGDHIKQSLANVHRISNDLTNVSSGLRSMMAHQVPAILNNADTAVADLKTVVADVKRADIHATIARVDTTINGVNAVIADVRSQEGTLGKLMYDKSLYNHIDAAVISADSLLVDLKAHPKRYVHFSVFGKKDK